MDWAGSYEAEWALHRVDRRTWENSGRAYGLKEASVSRDATDDVPLLESGSVTVDGSAIERGWYRLVMTANGEVRVPVATLLLVRAKETFSGTYLGSTANGYSVLKPASDRLLTIGAYAPKGADGAAYAASLLRQCTPAPVEVDGAFELADHVVFDVGISYLEAAWTVLDAGGYCMQIDGLGHVRVRKLPSTPSLNLSASNARLLMPDVEREEDTSDAHNCYTAVDGDEMATAVNDDPESPISIRNLGWRSDVLDTSPVRVGGETLPAYAKRKLAEETKTKNTISYSREFAPGVLPYDLADGSMPGAGLDGLYRIATQQLECGCGIVVSETAQREVGA